MWSVKTLLTKLAHEPGATSPPRPSSTCTHAGGKAQVCGITESGNLLPAEAFCGATPSHSKCFDDQLAVQPTDTQHGATQQHSTCTTYRPIVLCVCRSREKQRCHRHTEPLAQNHSGWHTPCTISLTPRKPCGSAPAESSRDNHLAAPTHGTRP